MLIPLVWLALVGLGVAVCRLASSSDEAETRAIREWAFASRRMWEEDRQSQIGSERPREREDRRRAAG